jgi:hypothetical protein
MIHGAPDWSKPLIVNRRLVRVGRQLEVIAEPKDPPLPSTMRLIIDVIQDKDTLSFQAFDPLTCNIYSTTMMKTMATEMLEELLISNRQERDAIASEMTSMLCMRDYQPSEEDEEIAATAEVVCDTVFYNISDDIADSIVDEFAVMYEELYGDEDLPITVALRLADTVNGAIRSAVDSLLPAAMEAFQGHLQRVEESERKRLNCRDIFLQCL